MKHLFFLVFISVCLLSHAGEHQLSVVSEHWPPYIIHYKNDTVQAEVKGVVTENIREILALANLDYSLNIYPWARSYHLATNKPNVLIYSIFKNEQREPLFHWFCPVYQATPIRIFKLATNSADISSLASLKNSVVGVMRDDNSYRYLSTKGFEPGVNLDISSNEEINLLKLITGKIDAVVQSEAALRYRLAQVNASNLAIVAGLTLHSKEKTEHCMALSKNSDAQLINKISTAFAQWQANATHADSNNTDAQFSNLR
ncbi:hypothetical protein DXX93_02965 [Thalassotalea euphylliae]|uniref:Uncharacterized protein n=1 Tax=Thalassotalea euphylliae TaxID=1655234 RepID=A0A3E0TMI8_9GAMM|nr:transporter substrate-binding domain-containing protein [Thalassotalea euphylliae]REL25613.1 hypothetical protein DXX93_02965 [Thalassotalea euphylliae]